jgi:cell wall-associated NlpC family hydrolase
MSGKKVVDIAKLEVGTCEEPKNSNKQKYGEWAKYNGVAWCALFVSWCYNEASLPLPKIGFRFPGFAGCQSGYAYFRDKKWITKTPKAGDIVLFDWNGDGRYDHTGIFVKDLGNGSFQTIEGNTALNNDSNGGVVMIRERKYSVSIFIHPPILDK